MIRKALLIGLGVIFLVLGGVGIVLPVLPTTPFVLCAAACFGASSPRLYKKLENAKFFGEYLRHYKNGGHVSRKTIWRSLLYLWIMLLISMLAIGTLAMVATIIPIGVAVSAYLFSMGRRKKS